MIRLRTRARIEGGERTIAWLRRPGLVIYALRLRGSAFDTAAISAMPSFANDADRCAGQLTVVLDGELVVRRARERTVEVGAAIVEGPHRWSERWEGRTFDCVVWEWGSAFGPALGPLDRASLTAAERARLRAIHAELVDGDPDDRAIPGIVRGLCAIARAAGIALRDPTPDELAPPPGVAPLAAALRRLTGDLAARPAWVDVDVGRSERQVRRELVRHADWLDVPAGSLRERLRRARVVSALQLLGSRARVEEIARAVGYGSPQALALAMRQLRMPSPAEIRARLR